jgi:hypothetical protein
MCTIHTSAHLVHTYCGDWYNKPVLGRYLIWKIKPDLGLSFGTCSRTVVKIYSFEELKARTGFLVPSMYGTRTNIFGEKKN